MKPRGKPFPKGHQKMGGRQVGKLNGKTEQWIMFSEYCLNGGLEKLQKELDQLRGANFVYAFATLLEFHKPKLKRTEVTGKDGEPIRANIVWIGAEHIQKFADDRTEPETEGGLELPE